MLLLPGNRQDHEFIEYTAVGHEASYGVDDHQREPQPYEDRTTIGCTALATSDRDVSGASKSVGANYHILETNQPPVRRRQVVRMDQQ